MSSPRLIPPPSFYDRFSLLSEFLADEHRELDDILLGTDDTRAQEERLFNDLQEDKQNRADVALLLSQFTHALQMRLTPRDAADKLNQLWAFGAGDAVVLGHFAPDAS